MRHRPHTKLKTPWKWKCLVTQLCPTLCNSMDYSPPDSSVHGILQAGILDWVAIPFSRGSSWPGDWTQDSCITGRLFAVCATRNAPNATPYLSYISQKDLVGLKLFYHSHGKETTNDTTIFQWLQHLLGLFTFCRHIFLIYMFYLSSCVLKISPLWIEAQIRKALGLPWCSRG